MKSLHFVSLAALAIMLLGAQSELVVHAQPPSTFSGAQIPVALATQPSLAKQVPIFAKPIAYDSGGNGAGPVAVADVNGDGKLDVIVGNGFASPSTVSVLLGNGDGTLQAPVAYNVGAEATSIATADANGDGKLDIVVATYYEAGDPNSGGVAVLLGNGDGTFQAPVSYSSGGYYAISVAIADVNGDGHPDLIAANQCRTSDCRDAYTSGNIGVLLGNGDGTFQAPVTYLSVDDTQWMVVADVNGDGSPDVLVAGEGDGVAVLLGNGNGTFQPLVFYDSGGFASAFAVGDVNADGKPDVVQAVGYPDGSPNSGLSVLLGNGDGTFQAPIITTLPAPEDVSGIAFRDLDGDGKPDVVVAGYFSGKIWALLGNGDGTFQAPETYLSGLKHTAPPAIADLNADGKPDLLIAGQCGKCTEPDLNLLVLLNKFDATSVTAVTSSPNPSLVNQSVTFTATVTSNPPIPDGEVIAFSVNAHVLGTGATKNGVASCTVSLPKATTYTVRATYKGDLFHKTSFGTVSQVVNP